MAVPPLFEFLPQKALATVSSFIPATASSALSASTKIWLDAVPAELTPIFPVLNILALSTLFVYSLKSWASVVPKKFVPAVVPLLPVKDQSNPPGEPAKAIHLVPFQ